MARFFDGGSSLTWLADDRIAFIQVANTTRYAVDDAVDTILAINQLWPVTQPYLMIVDVSVGIAVTPYARQRFAETNNTVNPSCYGRYAVLIHGSVLAHAIRLYLNREYMSAESNAQIEGQVFTQLNAAIQWTQELL